MKRDEREIKTVFIAHPIGDDIGINVGKVKSIIQDVIVQYPYVVPIAPYLTSLEIFDNEDIGGYLAGMEQTRKLFKSGAIDQVWFYGHKISEGMKQELFWAQEYGIDMVFMTDATRAGYETVQDNHNIY